MDDIAVLAFFASFAATASPPDSVATAYKATEASMEYSIPEAVRRIGKAQISASVEVTIVARREPVFDFVTAEDVLPKVLTGYGLLPAVVRTSRNTGPWDRPGSARPVHLTDGTT